MARAVADRFASALFTEEAALAVGRARERAPGALTRELARHVTFAGAGRTGTRLSPSLMVLATAQVRHGAQQREGGEHDVLHQNFRA